MKLRQRRFAIGLAAIVVTGAAVASAALAAIDGPATVDERPERLRGYQPGQPAPTGPTPTDHRFVVTEVDRFDQAWAMAFLPGTDLALITERPGRLLLHDMTSGADRQVTGVPTVDAGGQGGLGDVAILDASTSNPTILLTWVESGSNDTRGAVLGRATLDLSAPSSPQLTELSVLWRQDPKVGGRGHFSHRLALTADRRHVFVSSGDRQQMSPAQDPNSDLGKIIRVELTTGAAEHWSLGHRNPLGLAFAPDGRLWSTEMGPQGGDELNLIERGNNYGWPLASNGSHYDDTDIPDHRSGDGFAPPAEWWNPSISPGSLMIYHGDAFPAWRGDAFIGALSGTALVRIDIDGTATTEADHWDMDNRIRVVVDDPRDGTIWLIEDGEGGRLLHLTPA